MKPEQKLKTPPPVERFAATVTDGTLNEDARTIEVVFYTGASVLRMDWWTGEKYMLALSLKPEHVNLDRLNSGAPLLNSHQDYDLANVIGVVEKGWIEKGVGKASARFSSRAEVEPIFQDVKNKIIRNISMGASINRLKETTKDGDKMKSYLAVDWEVREISAVPVGADSGAGFLSHQEVLPDSIAIAVAQYKSRQRDIEILSLR